MHQWPRDLSARVQSQPVKPNKTSSLEIENNKLRRICTEVE